MPALAKFYGITIKMYFQQNEHNPPHIHAYYGDYSAIISIRTKEVIDGQLPPTALALVKKWMIINEKELAEIWEKQLFRKVAPLD